MVFLQILVVTRTGFEPGASVSLSGANQRVDPLLLGLPSTPDK